MSLAPSKKRMRSKESQGKFESAFESFEWRLISIVRGTSETTEAATGLKVPSPKKVKLLDDDKKRVSTEAVKQQTQPKTICGVDFGTTYSGVAIVGSVNCGVGEIEVLRNWKNGSYVEQVPSRIAYPEENPGLERIAFGYEVDSSMKSYTWMKLLLGRVEMDDFAETKFGTKAAHGMLELPSGKTAEDVVSDYLKCLYQHIMDHLAEESPGVLLEERPIEFWLTTPACWDDETNTLTRKCALVAGFGSRPKDSLCMMREPDAALVANVSSSVDKYEGAYKVRHSSNT